jgi:carbon-monoxide dehydrogenase large subunit
MAKFGVGASVTRKEDDRFLRGKGQYVGDFRIVDGQNSRRHRSGHRHMSPRGNAVRRARSTDRVDNARLSPAGSD